MEGSPKPTRSLAWIFSSGQPNAALKAELTQALEHDFINWCVFPMSPSFSQDVLRQEADEFRMEMEAL